MRLAPAIVYFLWSCEWMGMWWQSWHSCSCEWMGMWWQSWHSCSWLLAVVAVLHLCPGSGRSVICAAGPQPAPAPPSCPTGATPGYTTQARATDHSTQPHSHQQYHFCWHSGIFHWKQGRYFQLVSLVMRSPDKWQVLVPLYTTNVDCIVQVGQNH